MMEKDDEQYTQDVIDEDLYEELDEEEIVAALDEARQQSYEKRQQRKQDGEFSRRRFPKWVFWLIALAMSFHIVGLLPQTLSIPAIDFLITSAKLSTQDDIKQYKEAVVVIDTDDSKGTGFSVSSDGIIITNDHVVKGNDTVTVSFRSHGYFNGHVIERYPEIDIAVLELEHTGELLPFLSIDEAPTFTENEHIYFIGNPLKFTGIANEGKIIDYVHVKSKELPVMMLDAPVYRGNSGSPVINESGDVIGVVFATLHHKDEGRVGLFIPMHYYVEFSQGN